MPELTRKSRHEHSVARAPMKPQGLNRLAPDQLDILRLLAQGLTIEAIARRLNVSERTVRRKVRACSGR
jgi:DNA-binding NarL/FixJ family response regulator